VTDSAEDDRVSSGLGRQLALRRDLLDGGAAHVGWKVGFGGAAARESMRIAAPLVGFITDSTVIEAGTVVDTSGWNRGFIEFEVAVYMGQDLGAAASEAATRDAVAAVGPAIELADIDLPIEAARVGDILAGDIFHRGVVLGEPDPDRAGLDVEGLVARIVVDGDERAITSDLQANTGPYPSVVAVVADTLAVHGELLSAGDMIITGAVFPPMPLAEGREFSFALEPFDPISIRVS
jgi:2-keto-4-pentenoate hydratase